MTLPPYRLICISTLSALVGCRSDGRLQGTLVGNPGDASMTAAPSTGVEVQSARMGVADITWIDCDSGASTTVVIDRDLDLLGLELFDAPTGRWCTVDVASSSPLVVQAEDTIEGGTVSLSVDIGVVELTSAGVPVGENTTLLFELAKPDWLLPATLGYSGGASIVIEPGSAEHDALAVVVESGSAAYVDDGNLQVDPEEVAAGPIAEGPGHSDDDDDDDDD